MYKKCGESIDHLFLYCEFETELWNAILHLFGVDWVMHRRVSDMWEVGGDTWELIMLCKSRGSKTQGVLKIVRVVC